MPQYVLREDDERACPPVIRDVLVKKDGWDLYDEAEKAEDQPPFNLYWKTNRFYPSQIQSCKYPYQRCNHYPKSSEITKKDGLYRHMKRMRVVHGPSLFTFFPETFTLPNEYVKFCQYFAEERDKIPAGQRPPLYIVKPSDLSRGRKIFVFDDIGELSYDCSSVVQKYVDRPLLIFGHKVDFRIYVLVTSFQPLRVYMFDDFLTRFGGEKYTMDSKDTFVHLTNYSVTKTSTSDTLARAGVGETCKWDGKRAREYFTKMGVDFNVMWAKIETVVRCTLLSIFHLVPFIPQCFELYGFDVLFDADFQPWVIEVNFSPALAVESEVDVKVKHALIHDLIETLNIAAHAPPPEEDRTDEKVERDEAVVEENVPSERRLGEKKGKPPMGSSGRGCGAGGGAGGNGVALKRSSSSSRMPTVSGSAQKASPLPAAQSSRSRSSSSLLSSSRSTASSGAKATAPSISRVQLVDRPHGGMKLIFPFNPETEALSLRALDVGQFDASLKGMLSEVKKKDGKNTQLLREMAAIYAERSQPQQKPPA